MSKAKRPALFLMLVAVAAVAIWWFVIRDAEPGPLRLYGNVDIREVDLGFRVGGRLDGVAFEEGDAVEHGAVVARLDPVPLQDELAAARAEAAMARADLDRLRTGSRPEEVQQAEATVAEREATLRTARLTFERREKLRTSGAISAQEIDEAEASLGEAEARLASAREALSLAREGFRSEEVAAGEAALAAAEARVASALTRLDDAVLRAPSSGTVLSRVREPGAILSSGQTVITLSVDDPVWVRAYVPETALGEVWPGRKVSVTTDSRVEPYEGQIGFVSPTTEFTPKSVQTEELRTALVYRVRVIVEDPGNGLRQGMPVTVAMSEEGAPSRTASVQR